MMSKPLVLGTVGVKFWVMSVPYVSSVYSAESRNDVGFPDNALKPY